MNIRFFCALLSASLLYPVVTLARINLDIVTAQTACIHKLEAIDAKSKQKAVGQATLNSDKCINDTVTIDSAGKKQIKSTGMLLPKGPWSDDLEWCVRDACKPVTGHCATVTYTTFDSSKPTSKSKCEKIGEATTGTGAQVVAQDAVSGIKDSSGQVDSGKLSQVLQNLGVNQSKADAIATDPTKQDQAYKMIQDLASGDSARVANARDVAKNDLGITLNPDTVNKISSLQPDGFKTMVSGVTTAQQQQTLDTITASEDTFAQTKSTGSLPGGAYGSMLKSVEDKYGLTGKADGVLAKYMKVEGVNGNPQVCSFSGACGLFQYTAKTWAIDSARMNGGVPLDPSLRSDPRISAEVTASSIAYYQDKYGSLMNAAGVDPATGAYVIHNIGVGDGPRFLQALADNPNASVNSIGLQPVSIRNNPVNFGNGNISLAQAVQKIQYNMGGSTDFAANYPVFQQAQSPFSLGGSIGGAQTQSVIAQTMSPFAVSVSDPTVSTQAPAYATSPVGFGIPSFTSTNSIGGSNSSPSYPTNTVINNPNNQTSYTPAPVNVTASQQLTQVLQPQNMAPSVPATVQLIAQPTTARPGTSVLLIWSSTGLSNTAPCKVFYADTVVSYGNEGVTHIIFDPAQSAPVLHCTTQTGQLIDKNATITVQS
jgi:hypothetical protein